MMKDSTTMFGNRLTKKEYFLVNTFVFFTFWSFFTGFPIAFGGVFRTMIGGKLSLLLAVAQFFIYLYYRIDTPGCFSKSNSLFAVFWGAVLLFIFSLTYAATTEVDISLILPLFNVTFFMVLRDDLKLICIDKYIRILAVILTLSLIEYFVFIMFHMGIRLYSSLERVGFESNLSIGTFDQYLFNIINDKLDIPRFQSLCEEPGCVGTICGFLVFLTQGKDEYRFQYIVFIIAGAMSFSLAFFVMLAIHVLKYMRRATTSSIIIAILLIVAFFYFYDFFEHNVLFRFGSAEFDNRVTDDFNMLFMEALRTGRLLFPNGLTLGSFGAGAKMWIWRYGIISFILLFLCYYYYYRKKSKQYKSNYWFCTLFFVTFWLSFYQRHWITNLDYMIVYLSAPIWFGYNTESIVEKRK